MRPDREDTSVQEERLRDARKDFADLLASLSADALAYSKQVKRAKGEVDTSGIMAALRAAMAEAVLAEHRLDIAQMDLAGAQGQDL